MPKLFQLPTFFCIAINFQFKKNSISSFWISLDYTILKLTPQAQFYRCANFWSDQALKDY